MSVEASRAAGPEVCLVVMPYASLERPSIALSILKAVLAREGISASVFYASHLFAEEIGVYGYDMIGKTQSHSLAGEWTFSSAAFPGFEPDHDAYFKHIGRGLRNLEPYVRAHGGRGDLRHILGAVRKRAPEFVDRMARGILETGPRIVGCSSTFQQHCASLALLKRIKELDPTVITMMGGANCEASMGVVTHQECPWVDYLVSGEAEEVLPRLCGRVLGRRVEGDGEGPLPGVLGPECRQQGSSAYAALRRSPPRLKVEDMNGSPTPDYDDYFASLSRSTLALMVRPGLLIETSRGCWWGEKSHCTFCGLNGTSMGFRSKAPERVLEEFTQLADRYGSKTFEVVDNILDFSYFKTVIPGLTKQNRGFDIFYETKANLNRAQLRLLADAGIRWLQPGIESLDDGILRAIGKGTTGRQNLQLMKWAQECGIYVLWILLYDIPGESDEVYAKMAQWLPLITHLQPPSGLSFIQYNRFSPYHTRAKDFKINISPDRSYSYVYPWAPSSLEDFAYYFDDYTVERDQLDGVGGEVKRPGLRKLQEVVFDWQVQWAGRMNAAAANTVEPAVLEMRDEAGRILIRDTRKCRLQPEQVLEGLAAQIYRVCDKALRPDAILKELTALGVQHRGWEEVGAAVQALCDQKLLLGLDGWYLSLAVKGPLVPMPISGNYPGGRLRTEAEARALELLKQAEAMLGEQPW
jgi:ribosomal peptide maturation radical SAM protein 1